jgi:hypothetical protein
VAWSGTGTGVTSLVEAYNIDVTSVLTDADVATSTIEFETDGSDVLVVYDGGNNDYPDPARPGREGSKGILNAFELKLKPLEHILEFIDTSVANGAIEGSGPGKSASNRLNALINMFEATSDLIAGGYLEDACGRLTAILKKCDGQVPPPDFISGEAVEELADMILQLMEDLECE